MSEMTKVQKIVHGQYRVEHLRPMPEHLDKFIPLWELCNAAIDAGNKDAEMLLRIQMREYQYVIDDQTFDNVVTDNGAKDLLDKYFKGSAYTQTMRMGLAGAGTKSAADTQASHAGWLEVGLANAPTYTGNRPSQTFNSATGTGGAGTRSSVTPAQSFSITSSGTVAGCFINNGGSATKDDTTGVLFSAGDFTGGSKTVANLDTLNVTYTMTV